MYEKAAIYKSLSGKVALIRPIPQPRDQMLLESPELSFYVKSKWALVSR